MPQDDIFNLEQTVHDFVDDAITKYLDNKDEPDTKHQILDRVFPVERRIASIIHGLSTSMGTRVWEKLARAIAGGNGFKIHKPKDFLKPVTMPPSIDTMISTWKQEREAGNRTFTQEAFIHELRSECKHILENTIEYTNVSSGDGIDLWLEKQDIEYIFDIKTVQPNSGDGNNLSRKVMEWCAYRLLNAPDANIVAGIAFPYSPYAPHTTESWWQRDGNKVKPLVRKEDAFVQDDFWNLLSGQENTWEDMINVFDALKEKDYINRYRHLFYPNE